MSPVKVLMQSHRLPIMVAVHVFHIRSLEGLRILFTSRLLIAMFALFVTSAMIAPMVYQRTFPPNADTIKAETFSRLSAIRSERKEAVIARLEGLRQHSFDAVDDPVLNAAFNSFFRHDAGQPPASDGDRALDRRYVEAYSDFYDILFVAESGLVFHSIKRESDYNRNLFTDPDLSRTPLADALQHNRQQSFIDYADYAPSNEAAAFFATPVEHGDKRGWMVFQIAVNSLNAVMMDYEGLGRTGEVYLTNQQKVMLTQSRLLPHDTVLNQTVNTRAPIQALASIRGEDIFEDYRNVRVFSAYEQINFAGATWVIIVEIDESEVLSDIYMNHAGAYAAPLQALLGKGTPLPPLPHRSVHHRVDINEFARTTAAVETLGVATCTALSITADGAFTYLGHIYPLDDSYGSTLQQTLLSIGLKLSGDPMRRADLLGDILRGLNRHDVTPAGKSDLRVVLAAPHTDGFETLVLSLLRDGFTLNQIVALHGPGQSAANVFVAAPGADTIVRWQAPDGRQSWTSSRNAPTLEDLFKHVVGYDI